MKIFNQQKRESDYLVAGKIFRMPENMSLHQFVTDHCRYETTIPHSGGPHLYCQDIYYGVLRCLYVKFDIDYVFLVPKKSIQGLKIVISGQFLLFPVKFPSKKIFLEKFYCTKRFVFGFQRGVSRAIFEPSCSFPPLPAF